MVPKYDTTILGSTKGYNIFTMTKRQRKVFKFFIVLGSAVLVLTTFASMFVYGF